MTVRFTSNLQKGGALIEATAALVTSWDASRSVEANLAAATADNVFGAASDVRRSDLIHRILEPRYIAPGQHVISAMKEMAVSDRFGFRDACYFETTRTEPLLAAFAEVPLFEWYTAGRSTVTVDDALSWLDTQEAVGRTPPWSEAVRTRVARALLAALRDFGVLDGVRSTRTKHISQPYPSPGGFAYVCWRLHELGVTAATIETSPTWRRWLLTPTDIASLMADLAHLGVIRLNRAGSVLRVEWRAASLPEAVHAVA